MKLPQFLFLLWIFFPTSRSIAQKISPQDLLGLWQVEVGKGETPGTQYRFQTNHTLLIILRFKGRTEKMTYSAFTIGNEAFLDFAPEHRDSLGIQRFRLSKNKEDHLVMQLYSIKRYDRSKANWEVRMATEKFVLNLRKIPG
jgi:hypothetical protein